MLILNNITKRYEAGEFSVDALKGVSLNFRSSEFVSILGPSGCGKTTLLNIVGGLDNYTDGDLVINGKSTKNFSARDWDTYRNHSIGFVFQSYNLIPHQTVLANVELALALSGVKRAERTARAKEALDKVGLHGLYKKRPCEMSGGQMQRVAIARAIVNNPDIILADEPTGALDTETSIQVMDILKEISKDRLVVMVTHNPDLAEKYSTRTVKMLDGLLVDDSHPLSEEEIANEQLAEQLQQEQENEQVSKGKKKKPSMSFATSFMLSLKNLFTKRGRTILTSFAGSIGIIGIALIFAVSNGMSGYISAVQEDTLASYPLTLEQTNTDIGSMFTAFSQAESSDDTEHDKDAVYEKMALYNLTKAITSIEQSENDLTAFKKHLDAQLKDSNSIWSQSLNGVHYAYNLDLAVYTKDPQNNVIKSDTAELMADMIAALYGVDVSQVSFTGGGLMSMLMSSTTTMSSIWQELLPSRSGGAVNDLLKSQYDVVYGSWPADGVAGRNQVVLVVDENNEIDDMTLYALGLKSKTEIDAIIDAARNGTPLDNSVKAQHWSFEDICSKQYKVIFNHECYANSGDVWFDQSQFDTLLEGMYENQSVGLNLQVVGIVRPNPDASSHMLTGNICYTQQLTEYIINQAQNSAVVQAQIANKNVDILTNTLFKDNSLTDAQKVEAFKQYVQFLSTSGKSQVYVSINSRPTPAQLMPVVGQLTQASSDEQAFRNLLAENYKYLILEILSQTDSSTSVTLTMVENIIAKADYDTLKKLIPVLAAMSVQAQNEETLRNNNTEEEMAAMLTEDVFGVEGVKEGYSDQQCLDLFDSILPFSSTTYEDNLVALGCLDLAEPSTISLYAVSFSAKEDIEEAIEQYNETVTDESQKIRYTDFVGLIMSSVTTIIDAITYVLVAFVSISLIVSSIMIGVITLISVQERTKEIGILRAIGASKRNVSGMFNAETLIIGFTSGVFGVGITYILCIFVNIILYSLTGIAALKAVLPIGIAAILVLISMLLTLIAGIIPSRSAAKKDPVVALRTE